MVTSTSHTAITLAACVSTAAVACYAGWRLRRWYAMRNLAIRGDATIADVQDERCDAADAFDVELPDDAVPLITGRFLRSVVNRIKAEYPSLRGRDKATVLAAQTVASRLMRERRMRGTHIARWLPSVVVAVITPNHYELEAMASLAVGRTRDTIDMWEYVTRNVTAG